MDDSLEKAGRHFGEIYFHVWFHVSRTRSMFVFVFVLLHLGAHHHSVFAITA